MEDKRRCKRLPFSIPVHVYGRTERGLPFRYVTVAKSVNMNGALLPLAPRVKRGQTILLVNSFTQEERECRVVYVDATTSEQEKESSRGIHQGTGRLLARLFAHAQAGYRLIAAKRSLII